MSKRKIKEEGKGGLLVVITTVILLAVASFTIGVNAEFIHLRNELLPVFTEIKVEGYYACRCGASGEVCTFQKDHVILGPGSIKVLRDIQYPEGFRSELVK
jgi:hypothetical protein